MRLLSAPGNGSIIRRSALTLFQVCFGLIFFSAASQAVGSSCPAHPVIAGVANLECWDASTPVALAGQWQLDFQADNNTEQFTGLFEVPLLWRDAALPFTGRGVYRTTLIFAQPMARLGLKLPRSNMARKIVLIEEDGTEHLLFDTGRTGLSDQSVVPIRMPVVALPDLETKVDLVITIRNSASVHGGIEDHIWLAPMEVLILEEQRMMIYTMIVATLLIVFFLVNLVLWATNTKNVALLMLGLVALLSAARQAIISGFVYEMFPDLTTQFDSSMGWGTFLGITFLGSIYFRYSYPTLTPKWWAYMTMASALVGTALFLFAPLHVVQTYGDFFRPFLSLALVILLGFLWSGLREPSRELKYTLAASTVAVITLVADMLYYQVVEYYSGFSISAIGLLVFMSTETVMMTVRYSRSLVHSATLTAMNEQLANMAHTDPLTGLANRRAFEDALAREEARGNRSGRTMVVGVVDLDNLKVVNDKYGHVVGDNILSELATILKESIRAGDFSCRWGGDEFSILFPETQSEAAFMVSDRLRTKISEQDFPAGKDTIKVTVSIGLAEWHQRQDVDRIFKQADEACYHSKTSGRNQVTGAWQLESKAGS
jgi:diguanylate cyclase (GGDEF)-like protein